MTRSEFQQQALLNLMRSGRGDHDLNDPHIMKLMSAGFIGDKTRNIIDNAGRIYDKIEEDNSK